MSKYTTEVRFICEMYAGHQESVGCMNVDTTIEKSLPYIFDFSFPIFDENYRSVLETKILKHYYTKEIGLETVGLWKLKLNTRLNEIMPYYNQLYKSELLEFNPFYDVDLTRTHTSTFNGKKDDKGNTKGTRQITGSGETESKGVGNTIVNTNDVDNVSNTEKNLYSDTPQGSIQNLVGETYLTNARHVDNIGTTKRTGESINNNTDTTNSNNKFNENVGTTNETSNNTVMQNTEQYLESVKGKQGTESFANLLLKYRQTFLNIDMMIINDLSDLFFNLW